LDLETFLFELLQPCVDVDCVPKDDDVYDQSKRMAVKRVIKCVHVVPMGMANAFLIEGDDGLTLIDADFPGKEAAIFGATRGLGPSRVLCKLLYHPDERLEPVAIDQPLTAGEILPIAGGIEVIHTPGHCAGQVALLWRPGRMLFAGDVCMNIMGLGDPVGFESLEEGRASQRKVASRSFEAAGFGHGGSIAHDASTRFRNKWGKESSV
jgi:hypothetical protein